jgi:glycosyltransferase involved in cell wall biosynthesis
VTRGVSIVIPSWNGLELLKRFLPAIIDATICYAKQFDAPTEIVIVDDGSIDDSIAGCGQGFAEVRQRNRKEWASGRQGPGRRGREWARGEVRGAITSARLCRPRREYRW